MRKNYKPATTKTWYIRNHGITAAELRVVDETGHQIGLLKREDALQLAGAEGKDVVLIAPHANPPVAKIIDFKKFLYQEQKKQQEAKKGVKKSTVKDVQISLFIADGDNKRFIEKAGEFLNEGFQVRVKLMLRGRELGKRPMAFDKMNEFISQVPQATIASPPKFQGRVLIAVISRQKKTVQNYENKKDSVETV